MAFTLNHDIMTQVGKDVEYKRGWDDVVLTIEQMGCEWEELRELDTINFVEYLQEEDIEWMPDFEWGDYNTAVGWDYWETEKGRKQRAAYFEFWMSVAEEPVVW